MKNKAIKLFSMFTMAIILIVCIGGPFSNIAKASAKPGIPSSDEFSGGWVYLTTCKNAPLRCTYYKDDPYDPYIVPANSSVRVYFYDVNEYGNIWYYCRYDDPYDGSNSVGWIYSGNFY